MDGADIRELRKQVALTQEEFAHEIGVTFATVNRWENAKAKPSRLALRTLAVLREKTEAAAKRSSRRTPGKRGERRRWACRRGQQMHIPHTPLYRPVSLVRDSLRLHASRQPRLAFGRVLGPARLQIHVEAISLILGTSNNTSR